MPQDSEVKRKLRAHLLEVTRDGGVSGWVDRIGEVADKAKLNTGNINWGGPPNIVAFNVVQEAERLSDGLDYLEKSIKEYQNGNEKNY